MDDDEANWVEAEACEQSQVERQWEDSREHGEEGKHISSHLSDSSSTQTPTKKVENGKEGKEGPHECAKVE